MNFRILIIRAGSGCNKSITPSLSRGGFEVFIAGNIENMEQRIAACAAQLIILEMPLVDYEGIQLCTQIRIIQRTIPIIVITLCDDEITKILALEAGADSYIITPISRREMIARIRALLRRIYNVSEWLWIGEIRVGKFVLIPSNGEAYYDGKQLQLTPIEYRLLQYMMEQRDHVITKKNLICTVCKESGEHISSRALDVHIYNLRSKIPVKCIKTVYGIGYRFVTVEHIATYAK